MRLALYVVGLWVAYQSLLSPTQGQTPEPNDSVFSPSHRVAWCIVPFDDRKRTPIERAAMLRRLGFKKYAYDYRAEHIPQFDAELDAIAEQGIELTGWWFPTTLNDEAKLILEVLSRHQVKTQLWVTGGGAPTKTAEEQQARVVSEAARIRPIAEAAANIGCRVGLYNHGGWFGEPDNQIAIIKELNLPNIGIIYNQHHGHEHVQQFAELLQRMMPHLWVLNLNGMYPQGDKIGQKIVPLGQGPLDLELLRVIRESGYRGDIGILNHTQENAEGRLSDNLAGLQWIVNQLEGKQDHTRPVPTTWKAPQPAPNTGAVIVDPSIQVDGAAIQRAAESARQSGNAERGAHLFAAATSACISCHKIGSQGGTVGPDLSRLGTTQTYEQIAESLLYPRKQVKPEYVAITVLLADGRVVRGYRIRETDQEVVLKEYVQGTEVRFARDEIESLQETGTLMPDGIVNALSESQRSDLIQFLGDLGRHQSIQPNRLSELLSQSISHAPAHFVFDRAPLVPEQWPHWEHSVNRDRIYDYYAKEARYFRGTCPAPQLLPEFPGLDGGTQGHWGNQSDVTWADGRWNQTVLGSVQCGVYHGQGQHVTRAVCLQLGDESKHFVCFDPDTLTYTDSWKGDFLKFSDVRHGFMHGLLCAGQPCEIPKPLFAKINEGQNEATALTSEHYRGFYRYGSRTLFVYEREGQEYLDSVWFDGEIFERQFGLREKHPLESMTHGGPAQWPQEMVTQGVRGKSQAELGHPYAVDTLTLPYENPWHALMFCGDHDFLEDGSLLVCTMQGDVWHVSGIDDDLQKLRWKRFASGLHQPLGMVVSNREIYVLGRDQITRLHDLNGDDEADYYECFSRACTTSPAGHDYTCGLWRDREGNFYTASGKQGLLKISADGRQIEVLATGLRNPDGLGLLPDGSVTVPSSEGDWVPASMIGLVTRHREQGTAFFGHGGPRGGQRPDLPLVYLPRGLDNSSGGQVFVVSDRWGPLKNQLIHLSFGTGSHLLVLRDVVGGQVQGGVVPLPGEFLSGVHRGRFSPLDGQLYVSGMAGWGTYTPDDGCLHRIRYTGEAMQIPVAFHAHENGLRVEFAQRLDVEVVQTATNHFAQAWNYRYSGGYGSSEYSTRHLDLRGHDTLAIRSAHVLEGGREVFLEMPDLQPVNQLHLLVQSNAGRDHDLFLTLHGLDKPFTGYAGYEAVEKQKRPHPMDVDLARATRTKRNPFEKSIPKARSVTIETDNNLAYKTRQFIVRADEPIHLTLVNSDVVPHNWALLKPGTLQSVGQLSNQLIADPEAAAKQYIPETADVLVYTDIVAPHSKTIVYFRAPSKPGRYPYLCTFPGHWMAMNGEMIVE